MDVFTFLMEAEEWTGERVATMRMGGVDGDVDIKGEGSGGVKGGKKEREGGEEKQSEKKKKEEKEKRQ